LKPQQSKTLKGFEKDGDVTELLFSLPRHLSLKEKKKVEQGESGATGVELQELSTIIAIFRPTSHEGRKKTTYDSGDRGCDSGHDTGFDQANKSDLSLKSRQSLAEGGGHVTTSTKLGRTLSSSRTSSSSGSSRPGPRTVTT
jgi:hypothetical protein